MLRLVINERKGALTFGIGAGVDAIHGAKQCEPTVFRDDALNRCLVAIDLKAICLVRLEPVEIAIPKCGPGCQIRQKIRILSQCARQRGMCALTQRFF